MAVRLMESQIESETTVLGTDTPFPTMLSCVETSRNRLRYLFYVCKETIEIAPVLVDVSRLLPIIDLL